MCNKAKRHVRILRISRTCKGISLVETLIFIVVVGVAVAGVLAAYTQSVRRSADPLVIKQALAIAESFMDEIQAMPFTYCDPDDANAHTASSSAGCATTPEALGPESGENRYASGGAQFDNVNDYHGYNSAGETPAGIKNIRDSAIVVVPGYNVAVSITPTTLAGIASTDALLIAVTVTPPTGSAITLEGYRTRYAPNATP